MMNYIRKITKQYPIFTRLSGMLLFCTLFVVVTKIFNHQINLFVVAFPIVFFLKWLLIEHYKLKLNYLWRAYSILFFVILSFSNGWVNIVTSLVLLVISMILAALCMLLFLFDRFQK